MAYEKLRPIQRQRSKEKGKRIILEIGATVLMEGVQIRLYKAAYLLF